MSKNVNQSCVELCINCKENKIEINSDPYCERCWSLTEGYLLQISPLKVLSVINEGEKTYKQIMMHPALKSFYDKSSTSVGIPLRSLVRRNLIYMSNRISGTYSITEFGIMALEHVKN